MSSRNPPLDYFCEPDVTWL